MNRRQSWMRLSSVGVLQDTEGKTVIDLLYMQRVQQGASLLFSNYTKRTKFK